MELVGLAVASTALAVRARLIHNNLDKTTAKNFQPDKSMWRIFQIGFNKCGTRSLYKFFANNGVPSVHYDGGRVAGSMFRHFRRREPLIDVRYKNKSFFADMENITAAGKPVYVGPQLFRQLDREYPRSKFILNTRNREDWVRSRIAHEDGGYLRTCAEGLGLSEEKTILHWKQEWDDHHRVVLEHFSGRPKDLLVFDIDRDGPQQLVEFFRPQFRLRGRYYVHRGKTDPSLYQKAVDRVVQMEKSTVENEGETEEEKLKGAYNNLGKTTAYYDDLADKYDEVVVKDWGYKMPFEVAKLCATVLDGVHISDPQFLDLGCGSGLVAVELKKLGYTTFTGIDISQKSLNIARERGIYLRLLDGNLSQSLVPNVLPQEGMFDVLTCVGTTSYLDPEVLSHWSKLVKPGGLIVLTHKTETWIKWEPVQDQFVLDGTLEHVLTSEEMLYLPGFKSMDDRAKIYVFRRPQ